MNSRELENVVELSVQEDEAGVVNIQLEFCHICYLASLVLNCKQSNRFLFLSSTWSEELLSYFLFWLLPSFHLLQEVLNLDSLGPCRFMHRLWGSVNSLKICLCVHFSAERTHSM